MSQIEERPSADRGATLSGLFEAHLSVLLGAVLTGLVAIRVLVAAQFDAVTALAVLQNVGVGTVLLTTVIAVIPAAASLIAGMSTALAVLVPTRRRSFSAVACFAAAIATFSAPLSILGITVVVTAVIVGTETWAKRSSRLHVRTVKKLNLAWDRGSTAAIIVAAPFFVLGLQPWLAPEVVKDSAGTSRVAFVLDDGPRPVLLDFHTRRVEYLDAPLDHRTVCSAPLSFFDGQTLLGWANRGKDHYQSCSAATDSN